MRRIFQGPAKRGSQKWIQEIINNNPEILNTKVIKKLPIPESDIINWYSPLAEDDYAEYQDQSFLDLLNIELSKFPLSDFWPSRGPVWDALGKSSSGSIFIIEAKSHIQEIVSSGTKASEESLKIITASLNKTRKYLNSKSDTDWSKIFYQYTNRLAHLYLLRVLNNIPAYLLFVYFVNDKDMNGPKSRDEWSGAIKLLHSYLGINRHKLNNYVIDVFIDVERLLDSD